MIQEDKDKYKEILKAIVGGMIILLSLLSFCWVIRNDYKKNTEYKKFIRQSIGKTIVIQNDTLIVINYQGGGFGRPNGFMLSNGTLVDEEIIVMFSKKAEVKADE